MDGSEFLASFSSSRSSAVQFKASVPSLPLARDAEEVRIQPAAKADKHTGSSHVRLRSIVNCSWPSLGRRAGQLVAAHRDGAYLAYGLTTPGAGGQGDGVVRVWHRQSEERALLKGMRGRVQDLAFSHSTDAVHLGCVDEHGSLFVFDISRDAAGQVRGRLVLQVNGEEPRSEDDYHRIVWCPYIPDDTDDRDDASSSPSSLLVLTKNNAAELWNVDFVVNKLGAGPHNGTEARRAIPAGSGGRLCIVDHKAAITAAAFSPDGTAVATASLDGQVKFFQVYMASPEDPRCLHEWAPHGEKPVTSLFFLDNHKDHTQGDSFWRYVVTGANNDSEIKVWSCETWNCLQTVRFEPPAGGDVAAASAPSFKACLDLRARFLILSDLNRHSLYVLQLHEASEGNMRVVSASEFATPCAFLSLAVMDAGVRKVDEDGRTSSEVEDNDEESSDDDFGFDQHVSSKKQLNKEATVIDLYIVQPKSFQSCRISYEDAWQKLQPLNGTKASPPLQDAARSGAVVKVEPEDNVVHLSDDDDEVAEIGRRLQQAAVTVKQEPKDAAAAEEEEGDVKPNLEQLLTSASSANTSLAEAKDKITLLSPDAFDENKSRTDRGRVKEEPASEASDDDAEADDEEDDPVVIKDEITLDDSDSPKPVTKAALVARSGNSSPSREVQDILGGDAQRGSSNDDDDDEEDDSLSDEESFVDSQEVLSDDEEEEDDDEEEEEEEEEEEAVPVVVAAKQSEPQKAMADQPATATKASAAPSSTSSSAAPWPSSVPPVPKNDGKRDCAALVAPAQQQQQQSTLSSADSSVLLKKLNELTQLVSSQRNQMHSLRDEMKNVKQIAKNSEQKMIDAVKKKDQQAQDSLKRELDLRNHVLQQSLTSALQKSLERSVREEVGKALGDRKQQQQQSKQVLQSLCAASEKQVVDSMRAFVGSKAFADQVVRPMADKVAAAAQAVLKEQMTQVLVPAVERSVSEMLRQIQGSAQRSASDAGQLSHKLAEKVLSEVRLQAQQHSRADVGGPQLQALRAELQQGLAGVLHAIEASSALGAETNNGHGGASPHPSASPASRNAFKETQEKIKQLLAQGQHNDAFQTALSASNLQLVLATCEMVNPAALFDAPCRLSQSVLLSLLQQLSNHLEDRTDLKLKYLEEGVMCLDVNHQVVRKHVGPILKAVQEQVSGLLSAQEGIMDETRKRQLRMFTMAMGNVVQQAEGRRH